MSDAVLATPLLWLVDLDEAGPRHLEALPLKLDYCKTCVAEGDDATWIELRRVAPSTTALLVLDGVTAHVLDGDSS